MKFLVLGASQRIGSYNRLLAQLAGQLIREQGHEVEWLEYRGLGVPLYDDAEYALATLPASAAGIARLLQEVDGVVIATPEYNWSIPGHLKNLFDWLSCLRPYPFAGKQVLLMSASPSRRGGMLGLTQTQIPLTAMGAHVYPQYFALAQSHLALDEAGKLQEIALQEELQTIIAGFLAMTKAHSL